MDPGVRYSHAFFEQKYVVDLGDYTHMLWFDNARCTHPVCTPVIPFNIDILPRCLLTTRTLHKKRHAMHKKPQALTSTHSAPPTDHHRPAVAADPDSVSDPAHTRPDRPDTLRPA